MVYPELSPPFIADKERTEEFSRRNCHCNLKEFMARPKKGALTPFITLISIENLA
jgi:hypothetical protein